MLYLLAVVGALTIAVLLWRAFGPDRLDTAPSRRFVAPDDNPDFLRELGEQRKKPQDRKEPQDEEE